MSGRQSCATMSNQGGGFCNGKRALLERFQDISARRGANRREQELGYRCEGQHRGSEPTRLRRIREQLSLEHRAAENRHRVLGVSGIPNYVKRGPVPPEQCPISRVLSNAHKRLWTVRESAPLWSTFDIYERKYVILRCTGAPRYPPRCRLKANLNTGQLGPMSKELSDLSMSSFASAICFRVSLHHCADQKNAIGESSGHLPT